MPINLLFKNTFFIYITTSKGMLFLTALRNKVGIHKEV